MPNPNITLPIGSPQNTSDSPVGGQIASISEWQSSAGASCGGFWRDAALILSSALLVLYLGFQARRNVRKLSHRKSYVMIAYYALLWVSALLNLSWSLLQGWQCASGKAVAWNVLSLFTECGMLTLEISIVGFLLQENYASGLDALAHTFVISGSFVAVDILVQAILIFGFGVPLLISANGAQWGKWSILFMHALVLTSVYCYILFVHYSKWRDKLPPRPSFYNYVVVMFILNIVDLFACGMAGIGFGFGLWLYDFVLICRHSLYLPFLYVTFLSDFFQEEDWLLDNAYYSEMKDAGFFDTDWE
ncbi:protein CANDIDATE G-PROTEIN COUPLED RECEPTOR 2-like [Andrographis paniculata]|uniref:protein CANDIDATE G-PROTEIN COUPLED RECEPTOR 2-like n=1 Tax=Andrographis paniculata TaxID=175694 RepID=UPI0021E7E3A2|nr:protein CANDIDATE G-PROTEIN COUPLED RECEPTOR 2-like [Andrographis paniculata]